MTTALLPPSSFVGVQTRRLARPELLWKSADPSAVAFDADQVFCCPQAYEADALYRPETRLEWADRYGGGGTGAAGGSGRCAAFNSVQIKGVGATPLVAPDADAYHSSGTLMLFEAATEALFAGVYQISLPFGAVPVQAILLTGGRYTRALGGNPDAPCVRSLAVRPFVARPAHFMRNFMNPLGRRAAGEAAPGMTADAQRTAGAMAYLAANFQASLSLAPTETDEAALLDAGFREVARRLAWQCAASFAKRLPHGTLSCSNIGLDGAFLDFGVSNFAPAYRRQCWAHGQEPWTESLWPIRTLISLRQQLDKYRPSLQGSGLIGAEMLARVYEEHFQQRLAIEMCRMAGLTEDMGVACPSDLTQAWLNAMREVWTRGAHERFVGDPGAMVGGEAAPPPRQTGRYDLNAVMAAAGPCVDAEHMDRALAPLLDEVKVRTDFVKTACQVRAWLRNDVGDPAAAGLDAYLGRQALRKNAVIPALQRVRADGLDVVPPFRTLEVRGDTGDIGSAIDTALAQARQVLLDLDPLLPGNTGIAQMQAMANAGTPGLN